MGQFSFRSSAFVSTIPPSPLARFFFTDARISLLWLVIRLYIGYQWLVAGWMKVTGYSIAVNSFGTKSQGGSWVFGAHSGAALSKFIMGSLQQSQGPHADVQSWYAAFLQYVILPHAGMFSFIVAFGELLVGLGLIFGAFTGVAALFGVVMNMNYMLAGSVSINPLLGALCIFLILAWRIAGYYGADRILLPLLGTPWTGPLVKQQKRILPVPRPGWVHN
jgi:thiosulfate dehydrogenase [quinone] large subunit